jgi:Ni/Co efflux regulator RcnB
MRINFSNALKGLAEMTKTITCILIISFVMVWSTGCQEQGAAEDQGRRLLVLENRELKTQLKEEAKKQDEEIKSIKEQSLAESKKRDDEVNKLENQHQDELKKREDALKQCNEELSQCEQIKSAEMQKESDKQVWDMVSELGQKNDELTAEVERLKAELVKAKGQ